MSTHEGGNDKMTQKFRDLEHECDTWLRSGVAECKTYLGLKGPWWHSLYLTAMTFPRVLS